MSLVGGVVLEGSIPVSTGKISLMEYPRYTPFHCVIFEVHGGACIIYQGSTTNDNHKDNIHCMEIVLYHS